MIFMSDASYRTPLYRIHVLGFTGLPFMGFKTFFETSYIQKLATDHKYKKIFYSSTMQKKSWGKGKEITVHLSFSSTNENNSIFPFSVLNVYVYSDSLAGEC